VGVYRWYAHKKQKNEPPISWRKRAKTLSIAKLFCRDSTSAVRLKNTKMNPYLLEPSLKRSVLERAG
jgi:hypothetical protein